MDFRDITDKIPLATELGLQIIEKRITRDEVYGADEAFFTGTAAEVTPIRRRVCYRGRAFIADAILDPIHFGFTTSIVRYQKLRKKYPEISGRSSGIPIEAIVAMQACARLGLTHSVVFGGFSAKSIHERILDAGAYIISINLQKMD